MKSLWLANIGLAAINVYAFVDSAHDGFVLSVGAALGYIFAYDLLRGRHE